MLALILLVLVKTLMSARVQDSNVNADALGLPLTFFTSQSTAITSTSNFFKLYQCDDSTSMKKYVLMTIMTPDNINLSTSLGYAAIEVSTVQDYWNSTTVIGTNYIFDDDRGIITQVFNNITWVYPGDNQAVFVRYRAFNRDIPISMQVTYSDDVDISPGLYDKNAYRSVTYDTGTYIKFSQLVQSSSVFYTDTNAFAYYYFNLCPSDLPFNQDGPTQIIDVIVSAISVPTSPLSATTMSICPRSQVSNPEDCIPSSIYSFFNECACSINVVQVQYSSLWLQGAYITVLADGSPLDNKNGYLLTVSTISTISASITA